jgi:ankyrin repeat protein
MQDTYGDAQMLYLLNITEKSDVIYLKLALEHGGNPNAYDKHSNNTLLMDSIIWARSIDSNDPVKMLVNAGADLEQRDNFERTAIHKAAMHNEYEILLYLLEQGADYTAKDKNGVDIVYYLQKSKLNSGYRYYERQHRFRKKVVSFLQSKGYEVELKYP